MSLLPYLILILVLCVGVTLIAAKVIGAMGVSNE